MCPLKYTYIAGKLNKVLRAGLRSDTLPCHPSEAISSKVSQRPCFLSPEHGVVELGAVATQSALHHATP